MGGGQSTFDWRIDGFSSMLQRETEQYDSLPFRFKGYKWKLSLWPKSTDAGGEPCLGLYLDQDGAAYLPADVEVHTVFELHIYNQQNVKWDFYGTVEGSFCDTTTSWGHPCMITLEEFQSPSYGLLVDDICGFRVKMLSAHKRRIGWKGFQRMLIEKPPEASSYTWNIQDFAKRRRQLFLTSGVFLAGNYRWNIKLYPNGRKLCNDHRKFNYLSIYLNLVSTSTFPQNSKLHVEFSICLVDQINGKHKNITDKTYFDSKRHAQGCTHFLPLEQFYNLSKGFLVRDLCVVEVKITDWHLIYK